MATDCFLKIDGIPGESKDAKHKDEIQVEAFRWGAEQGGSMAHGGGGGVGKVKVDEFVFHIKPDKAGPKLFKHIATGTHIKSAVLTCRKAGGQQEDYAKWTLKDVLVTSFDYGYVRTIGPRVSLSHDNVKKVAMLEISFSVAEFEYEYSEQKADGSLGPGTKVKYNLKRMQAG
jgi:type VI secretion system secreted protein Hcp